jgi:nicotinamidase-related amidase
MRALLVIDMQNDFCRENGTLFVKQNQTIIPRIKREIELCRKARVPIIYTQDWHEPNDAEFELWPKHCIRQSWGAEIVDELKPAPRDLVVRKNTYSAFFKTRLDSSLRKLGIKTLILTGCITYFCVLFTAKDAHERGYRLIAKRDCLGFVSRKMHEFALDLMRHAFKARIE